jgi:hypothetical protein
VTKEDLYATAVEMVYGTGIRLPAKFLLLKKQRAYSKYRHRQNERTEKARPVPVKSNGEKNIFIFKEL